MPTYDYECQSCGLRFELFQNMTADPIADCPKCKKSAKRLIGAGGGIIFKGKGFYATDYKKRPEQKDAQDKKEAVPGCPMSKECGECKGPSK